MDTRLVHPFTCVVAGPTGCGKTTFFYTFVRPLFHTDKLSTSKDNVVLGEWQPLYSTLSTSHANIYFVEGLPDLSSFDAKTRNLGIIDDLMSEADDRITKLFTKKSRHCSTSVLYLVQHFRKAKRVAP